MVCSFTLCHVSNKIVRCKNAHRNSQNAGKLTYLKYTNPYTKELHLEHHRLFSRPDKCFYSFYSQYIKKNIQGIQNCIKYATFGISNFNVSTKGQLISKANCQGRGFSQKTNKNTSHTSKNEFIRSFFGRILGQKKTFRDYLTFSDWHNM